MNDKYTNQLFIKYKYYDYCHYSFRDNSYKLVDIYHPFYKFEKYYIVQRLYHSNNNVKIFKDTIINNVFLKKKQIQTQIKIFIELQKFKRALHKFIFICKFKVKKEFNKRNLCYDELKNNSLFLLEDNIKYGFDLFEIKKIANNSFNYLDIDFPHILHLKNPYTNKPFNVSNLYNIYFYLYKNMSLPLLFHCYFKHNLNKDLTTTIFLNNHYIDCYKNKYNNFTSAIKVNIIRRMLQINKYHNLKYLPYEILVKHFIKIGLNFYIYENLYLNEFSNDVTDYYKLLYRKPLVKIYLKNRNYNKKTIKRDINNKTTVFINKNFTPLY